MTEYRLDPATLPRRRLLVSLLMVGSISIAGGVVVGVPWYLAGASSDSTPRILPLAVLSVLAICGVFTVRRQLNRAWEEFLVRCEPDVLVIQSAMQSERRIAWEDVQEVSDVPNKGLVIHCSGSSPLLLPHHLLNFPELKARVSASIPKGGRQTSGEPLERARRRRDRLVATALCLIIPSWVATGLAPTEYVAPLGIFILALVVYLLMSFERIGLPKRFVRPMRWGLVFILLAAPARLWLEYMRNNTWGW